jgi:serine phosphatase RsbU (regulator of sigma subunit)
MLMIQIGLSSLILHNPDALPHQILPALNQMLYENLRRRMGRDDHATLTMLRFFSDGRLLYAGAHEDIVVCSRTGEVRTVPTHGTWVGISPDISHDLESRSIQLAPDDLVVLYTDGIPEARRGRECFGMPRLIATVERYHAEPVEDVVTGILHTVLDYNSGVLQDDATLLVLRYHPATGP